MERLYNNMVNMPEVAYTRVEANSVKAKKQQPLAGTTAKSMDGVQPNQHLFCFGAETTYRQHTRLLLHTYTFVLGMSMRKSILWTRNATLLHVQKPNLTGDNLG